MTSYYYKCQIFPNLSSSTVQKHRKNNECCVPLIPNPDNRLFRFQVCYCDISVLRTPRTLLRVLVLVRSTSCLFPESIWIVLSSVDLCGLPVERAHVGERSARSLRPAPLPQAASHHLRQPRRCPLLPPCRLPQHISPSRTLTDGLCQNGGSQFIWCVKLSPSNNSKP